MMRAIPQEVLLFILPFVAFAIYLIVHRRNPLVWAHWSDQSIWLTIAGLAVVVVSLITAGVMAERQTGAYEPTHIENGRVVPGHFK